MRRIAVVCDRVFAPSKNPPTGSVITACSSDQNEILVPGRSVNFFIAKKFLWSSPLNGIKITSVECSSSPSEMAQPRVRFEQICMSHLYDSLTLLKIKQLLSCNS